MTKTNDGLHAVWDTPMADETAPDEAAYAKAFEFVQSLAGELSKGRVELPAYPEVAMRVREVLGDEDVTNDRIAKIIASDAGLATRMLAMANSAALSRGGKPLADM